MRKKSTNRAIIGKQPNLNDTAHLGSLNWLSGSSFDVDIPEPLVFELNSSGVGDITDFFPPAVPVMSKKMLEALMDAGVDNIDSYEAKLLDRNKQPVCEEFRAVNILGKISCADLDASDC